MQPSDAASRQRALDPRHSFICEAPAGSGKTELLTQRILTLLARVDNPEAVLAITFTRKAAAEMRERVLAALRSGLGEAPADQHRQHTWRLARAALARDAEAGWQLLRSPQRLQIKTFDSLARQLMQSLPLHAGLDATWPPQDDAEPLYREAARDLLDTLEQEVSWADHLMVLFRHLDNSYQTLEQLWVGMLANRDAWMNLLSLGQGGDFRPLLEEFLALTVADKVAQVREQIPAAHVAELLDLARFAGANLRDATPPSPLACLWGLDTLQLPLAQPADLTLWRALAGLLLTDAGTWRKSLTVKQGFPPGTDAQSKRFGKAQKARMTALLQIFAEASGLLEVLQDILHWPTTTFSEEQWPVLEALLALLPIAVVHLRWVFQRRQVLDFTEISQQARAALGEDEAPTALLQRMDYTIAHILVDEFQDTSFTQVEMLKKLTYGWQPDDGRTLFCVGDAMQSIYGFRGANVGLFLYCQQHGLGDLTLENLRLTANFRSQGGIVTWVNRVFAGAFPERLDITGGAVPFAPAQAFRDACSPAVSTQVFSGEDEALQAGWLVREIAQLRRTQPEWRIGILVKARNHARAITSRLQAAGMRFRAQELVPLAEREAVQDALTLTFALLDPSDRISWLAVLRMPWCGLSLMDFEALMAVATDEATVLEALRLVLRPALEEAPQQDLFPARGSSLSTEGRARLERVYPLLDAAWRNRERKPCALWVEGTWRALGGAELLEAEEDQANLQRYWRLLEELTVDSPPDRPTLERAMAKLYATPDPRADDCLQIMTIHKSKGLEFDVVFLPDLQRRPRNTEQDLLLWQERLSRAGEDTLLLAPINARGGDKDPIYQHLYREKSKRERLEQCRLLYVACTRARERLYLLAHLQPLEKGGESRWQAPAASSLLRPIWSAVEGGAESVAESAPPPGSTGGNALAAPRLKRVPLGWRPAASTSIDLLAGFVPRHAYANQALPQPLLTAIELPRTVGTLIHEMAFRLLRDGSEVLGDDRWRKHWRARLQVTELPEAELEGAVERIERVLAKLLVSERFAWLQQQPQKYLEFPLTMLNGDTVKRLVLDALVIDTEGAAWVIDYKTSQPYPGEAEAAFIDRESKTYGAIMRTYQKAVSALGYQQVRSALYFLEPDLWVEL